MTPTGRGLVFAALAYALWGVFPLYFQLLASLPAVEVVAHRVVWSLAFLLLLLAWRRQWAWLADLPGQPRVLLAFGASALLLALNWGVYIWAVTHGRVVEASLGYFITPLVNVVLGTTLLKERMRPGQWAALALAVLGVSWLTLQTGRLPWIALVIGASFGAYGLLRKVAPLGALEGLTLETLLLAPVAAAALLWWWSQGVALFPTGGGWTGLWLVLVGPVTAIPLLLFAAGARRIRLSTLGLLQYISPTLQFGLGVLLFREPMSPSRLAGFALIWTALAVYSADAGREARRAAPIGG